VLVFLAVVGRQRGGVALCLCDPYVREKRALRGRVERHPFSKCDRLLVLLLMLLGTAGLSVDATTDFFVR
jgi:hypothetical protein